MNRKQRRHSKSKTVQDLPAYQQKKIHNQIKAQRRVNYELVTSRGVLMPLWLHQKLVRYTLKRLQKVRTKWDFQISLPTKLPIKCRVSVVLFGLFHNGYNAVAYIARSAAATTGTYVTSMVRTSENS